MIYLASDHGGVQLKNHVAAWLAKQKFSVQDLGPHQRNPNDDYPIWAARVARLVQRDPGSKGILLCRSGVGMAIVANKFRGVRAVQGVSAAIAKQSRVDEDTNVLSLAADHLTVAETQRILRAWVTTPYRNQRRHERRLKQIANIEHVR